MRYFKKNYKCKKTQNEQFSFTKEYNLTKMGTIEISEALIRPVATYGA
jgi:hypothetical protein